MDKKPIEIYFPIHEINKIASKESGGGASKIYFRPIYYMHKTFATRLGTVFRSILLYSLFDEETLYLEETLNQWKKITKPKNLQILFKKFYSLDLNFKDKIVLDPFFGSGVTLIEAIRFNCKIIGKELNPVPWFITKKELDYLDLKEFKKLIQNFKVFFSEELEQNYKTNCPKCNEEANVLYFFWVKEVSCLTCSELVPLFKNFIIADMRSMAVENKSLVQCSNCLSYFNPLISKKCITCNTDFKHDDYLYVICPQCNSIFGASKAIIDIKCPLCESEFNYKNGNTSGQYYYCSKGHKRKIIESIERNGKPSEKLYAIEYYCQKCDKKGYKSIDENDIKMYNLAKNEYSQVKYNLPIPQQKIPKGKETYPRLANHGYFKFKDMFNKRQLLSLGKLLIFISSIPDQNYKEFFLLAFSAMLEYNNAWGCLYETHHNKIGNAFSKHAFHPRTQFVENNFTFEKFGGGTYFARLNQIIAGKEFCYNPYEKFFHNNKFVKKPMRNQIRGKFINNYEEMDKRNNILLLQGSSEYLEIPDNSIDAIITDPPYYDNIMYSELYDYFYVWLREALKDIYDHFKSEITPKRAEIIKNKFQNKGNEEYTKGLTTVFNQCFRVLKDQGVMVFTFHHSAAVAWTSILETILSSNFYVSAIYPIQGEMSSSAHIFRKANIEYDIIIVCRKRLKKSKKVEWKNLKDEIFLKIEKTIQELEVKNEITEGDKFVIAMGKCLEKFSENWPEVYNGEKLVKIEEAVEDIKNIVDNYFNKIRFSTLEKETDRITAIYLQFLANIKTIDYNELNKAFQQRNLNINEIFEKKLAIKEKNKVKIQTYNNRKEYLENLSQDKMTAIDQVHYIFNLRDDGRLTQEDLSWIKDETLMVLKRLNVKDSDRLIKYIKKARTQKKIEL